MLDTASFWTDIKDLEEQLSKYPDSLCFARLSEVYLKVGLVDDALHAARLGVLKHPRYLSGQKALSLACHAKGLNDEALTALKIVTEALPEDTFSQKLLGRLSAEAGDLNASRLAFQTVLEFAPDDIESRIELESIGRSAGVAESDYESDEGDEEIIEDLEILEEYDILEAHQPESEFRETFSGPDIAAVQHLDPLSTGTLAELYVKQGFIHKALEIYRVILTDNPADIVTAERIAELEALKSGPAGVAQKTAYTFEEEAEVEPVFEERLQEIAPSAISGSACAPTLASRQASADVSWHNIESAPTPQQGAADNTLATLDGWLENIRRIKSCR